MNILLDQIGIAWYTSNKCKATIGLGENVFFGVGTRQRM